MLIARQQQVINKKLDKAHKMQDQIFDKGSEL